MNGELAETISLAAHGSAWLAGASKSQPPALDATHSTYQYVGSLQFILRRRGPRRDIAASNVATWLGQLRERGIERLWLSIPDPREEGPDPPDRMMVSFAGAGEWHLLADGEEPEGWHGNWEVGDPEAADQRIWRVLYLGTKLGEAVVPTRPDMSRAAADLLDDLQDAHDFADRMALEPWAEWFERAIALGTTKSDPQPPWHPDLLPATGYTPEARRLIAMATQSWVFGGMGSWNDLAFEGAAEARYQDVSRRLYSSMLNGFLAATNSDLI